MQRAFQTLVRTILRSRWAAAAALMVLIVAIVALARLLSGPAPNRTLDAGNQPAPTISVDPLGDDSVISPEPPPSPTSLPGTPPPAAVAYAFAADWADTAGVAAKEWRDRLRPHTTEKLAAELADTDPTGMPVERVTGEPTVVALSEGVVEARVKTTNGELRLQLIAPEKRWLVDAINWQRQ
jgi:hypothetical protein